MLRLIWFRVRVYFAFTILFMFLITNYVVFSACKQRNVTIYVADAKWSVHAMRNDRRCNSNLLSVGVDHFSFSADCTIAL